MSKQGFPWPSGGECRADDGRLAWFKTALDIQRRVDGGESNLFLPPKRRLEWDNGPGCVRPNEGVCK